MLPTIILVNTSASPITLTQLAATIPALGNITISLSSLPFEILNDTQLNSLVDAGTVTMTVNGVVLTANQSKAFIDQANPINICHNFQAVLAPTATDDATSGYSPGSLWVDLVADESYTCVDATPTLAVWKRTSNAVGSSYLGFVTNVASDAPSSTSSNVVWVEKASMLSVVLSIGANYILNYTAQLTTTASNGDFEVRVQHDNLTTVATMLGKPSGIGYYVTFAGSYKFTAALGLGTFDMDYRRPGGSGSATIKEARMSLYRIF